MWFKGLESIILGVIGFLLTAGCSGGSDSSALQPDERPSTPTACSPSNQGNCECNNAQGFTTWTWWVADQQRCATTYVPDNAEAPLPVLISNDGYSRNGLGECRTASEMVEAAQGFGFVGLCTTSPDGDWTFGNDGVMNDQQPTPCTPGDSKDIRYLNGVFEIIDELGASGKAKPDEVYTWGFSQNAMFTAWTAFCYPDRIKAFWQGGSGLFVKGQTNPLPLMEGACRKSDYLQYGRACAVQAPCTECQYFPIYPVATTPPLSGCIMAYVDDFLFETAAPMADAMTTEGHDATLLQFPDIGRGHSEPLLQWDWLVGCMGVGEACSEPCSEAIVACIEGRGGATPQQRESDYVSCQNGELASCNSGCAPTLEMLRVVERPCVVNGICESQEDTQTCAVDCGSSASPAETQ